MIDRNRELKSFKDKVESSVLQAYVTVEMGRLKGKKISVSKEKPDVVKRAAGTVSELNPSVGFLCGAGVSNGDDVRAALDLGAHGVILASAVSKSKDPKSVIKDLIRGFE